jgi:hypothetical protein
LQEDYEELRSYAISSAKTISHPVGLDLWLKKGFMSWTGMMLLKDREKEPSVRAPMGSGNAYVLSEVPISLANIIIEWSEVND